MLSGEGNAGERWKTTIGLISKKATLHVQHTFFVHFFAVVLHDCNVKLPETFLWRKCHTSSRSLFFTAAHFLLALVAASISHFVIAAIKFSCRSSNKKMCLLCFLSLALDLCSPFSRWVSLACRFFSFSLSFSCSIFQICGHDNLSKLNTLDNTDTETISAFRFRLYWLFSCLCFTRRGWLCDFPSK